MEAGMQEELQHGPRLFALEADTEEMTKGTITPARQRHEGSRNTHTPQMVHGKWPPGDGPAIGRGMGRASGMGNADLR